ncbi:MAG: hypothetical protein DWQ05_02815 [Calditrichaeota bacterium]|nr:MAG: hypothetical protein DWQ05_02815 [Calditrichota bacterium]
MQIKKRYTAIFSGMILFISLASGQEITQQDGSFRAKIRNQFDVKFDGQLNIRVSNGRFNISGWEKQEVRIEETLRMDVYTQEEARRILERSKANYEQDGPNIIVQRRGGGHGVFRSFTIKVPNRYNIKLKTSSGEIEVSDVEGKSDINTTGGDIRISRCNGIIDARTSGGDVELTSIRASVEINTAGGNIELNGIDGEIEAATSGGYIELNNTTQQARIRTSGGDLLIKNAKGEINGRTSGGSIRAENCEKDLKIRTSGGNISLTNTAGQVQGYTSGGDIDGKKLFGECDLSTSGGEIELKDVRAPVLAKTMGGNIDVEMTLRDFSKPHFIDLNTASGDIILSIPEKLPATIRAEIRLDRNRRTWKRHDIFSDFPLTKSTTKVNQRAALVSEGEINGGGDTIFLSTSNGDISIKKAK